MSDNAEGQGNETSLQSPRKSCDRCYRHKSRCDGRQNTHQPCLRCQIANFHCTYSLRLRRSRRSDIESPLRPAARKCTRSSSLALTHNNADECGSSQDAIEAMPAPTKQRMVTPSCHHSISSSHGLDGHDLPFVDLFAFHEQCCDPSWVPGSFCGFDSGLDFGIDLESNDLTKAELSGSSHSKAAPPSPTFTCSQSDQIQVAPADQNPPRVKTDSQERVAEL